jgi:ribosome-associated heat shock protein Hsp15
MSAERVRLDKWLWAARFFKTRGLAAEAIQGGRVHVGRARAKPAREVRVGDVLEITAGQTSWTVEVRALSDRRGPASEAALLYAETAESRERRERLAAERRAAPTPGAEFQGRPTKRDRRRIAAIRASLDPRHGGRGRRS